MSQSHTDTSIPIADGDEVEVVLRGKIRLHGRGGSFWLEGRNLIVPTHPSVISVTKVVPPYEPQEGDVVACICRNVYIRSSYGEWRTSDGLRAEGNCLRSSGATLLVRDGQVVSS